MAPSVCEGRETASIVKLMILCYVEAHRCVRFVVELNRQSQGSSRVASSQLSLSGYLDRQGPQTLLF